MDEVLISGIPIEHRAYYQNLVVMSTTYCAYLRRLVNAIQFPESSMIVLFLCTSALDHLSSN